MSSPKDKKTSSKKSDDKEESKSSEEKEDLESLFVQFAKFGDRESDGTITLRNVDKWLKQANILDNKELGIKTADTAITFSKIVKNRKRMTFDEFKEFMETLASDRKMEVVTLNELLLTSGSPSLTNVTTPVEKGNVGAHLRRMTDTTLYTGAHKARFDEEGKGKGKEGREDRTSNTGEVSGYKKPKSKDSDKKKKDEKKEKK